MTNFLYMYNDFALCICEFVYVCVSVKCTVNEHFTHFGEQTIFSKELLT